MILQKELTEEGVGRQGKLAIQDPLNLIQDEKTETSYNLLNKYYFYLPRGYSFIPIYPTVTLAD